jgi:hypothetical protein
VIAPDPVAVRPTGFADLPTAVAALGLTVPCPVVALVGGAAGLTGDALSGLFSGTIAVAIREAGAVAVDGGTDAGVMRLLGRARHGFPLVGVAAVGTIAPPSGTGEAALEPHHTHFVLVPGNRWGDEAPYLARVATLAAGGAPAVTVLVNGGEITFEDCRLSIAENRPVLVLDGTGRTADTIASATTNPANCRDTRAVVLAQSPLVRVEHLSNRNAIAARLHELLTT